MRKTYFARSEGARPCQADAASRAASTARATSAASASATSASVSSVAGLIVGSHRPLFGSTNSPPMNRPYRSSSRTTSVDSGALAYSHSGASPGRSIASLTRRLVPSVDREVVRPSVVPGAFLLELHQHVVQQARRPDAEAFGRHPPHAERLVQHHQELDRLLRPAHAAGDLHTDGPAGLRVEVARRFH